MNEMVKSKRVAIVLSIAAVLGIAVLLLVRAGSDDPWPTTPRLGSDAISFTTLLAADGPSGTDSTTRALEAAFSGNYSARDWDELAYSITPASLAAGKNPVSFELRPIVGAGTIQLPLTNGVVLIHTWRPACAACRNSVFEVRNLVAQYEKSGLRVIGLAADETQRVTKFIGEHDISWPQAKDWKAAFEKLSPGKQINFPSWWLIDRKGVLKFSGTRFDDIERKVRYLCMEK